jgi:uncharacterized protein
VQHHGELQTDPEAERWRTVVSAAATRIRAPTSSGVLVEPKGLQAADVILDALRAPPSCCRRCCSRWERGRCVLRDSGNLSAAPWTLAGMESADMRQNGQLAGKKAAEVTEMTSPVNRRLTGELSAAAGKVASLLKAAAPLGVAFSGGVDSSVLLALGVRALGADHVIAILGVSPSLGSDERLAAYQVATFIGARLIEVQTREADNPGYRANGPDRCFHCKNELFTRIADEVAGAYSLKAVAYGENADDAMRPDRPGSRAATSHKVLRPLAEAGIGKATVRAIARALQLPSADMPAAPCLASRIPHFQEVSAAKLGQIEAAEKALRGLGFAELRVRHHGEVARIELLVGDLVRAVSSPVREQIHAAVTAAGFQFAAIDVRGIQSGAFTLTLLRSHD